MPDSDFLTVEDVLAANAAATDRQPVVLDAGLLESAVFRPRAMVFGELAYTDVHQQAAALLQSLIKNHALQDGNKRTALVSTLLFLGLNGWRSTATQDELFDLVIAITTDQIADVAGIAARLHKITTNPGKVRRT